MGFDRFTAHSVARRVHRGGLSRQWALWRLVRAGDRGDPVATDVAWDLWLETPDQRLWAALSRWGRPHTRGGQSLVALRAPADPVAVAAAACRSPHPVAATARAAILDGDQDVVDAACAAALSDDGLAAFCVEHRLAPSDPHRAAVYFLLTGQREQYRLVDPDHSLLAVAYRGAAEDERARIRAEAAGDPDLVRALAGTLARPRLGDGEAGYLVDAFAARQDWPALWELAKNLPMLDAVRAVRRFDGPRPDGADGALFDALAAADPDALAASHRALAATIRLPLRNTTNGSIAPDGRHLVVGGTRQVHVCTFPDGGLVETWPVRHNSTVLALDDGMQVYSYGGQEPGDTGFTASGYLGDPAESTRTARFHRARALARTADGFAALTLGDHDRLHLHLLSGRGHRFGDYERRTLEVCGALGIPARHASAQWAMAVEPVHGLIAFAGAGLHLARITAGGLRPLAALPFTGGVVPRLAFSGPGRLVGQDDRRVVRVWRIDDGEPHLTAERAIKAVEPVDLPWLGVIAMNDLSDNTGRSVLFLDRDTLTEVPVPARFTNREDPVALFASPDAAWFGVGYRDFVEVFEVLLSELVTRPLAAATPADLHTVRARLGRAEPVARPLLAVLRTCLEHRFGGDIALGTGTAVAARPDDIALGGRS
ncbi:hypothetical protein [Actinophytocola sp. KF-1]